MIDYAKIENYDEFSTVPKLIQSGILQEHQSKKGIYTWYNFEIDTRRKDNIITLSGSVHKLYNYVFKKDGYANFSDYTFPQLVETINFITETFGINPVKAFIRSIEFGVNVAMPCNSKELIIAARTLKNTLPETKYSNHFNCFKFQQYKFKFYDKATQFRNLGYEIEGERLRAEIHVDRMIYLENYGIRYLADILQLDKLILLVEPLLQTIKEIQLSPGIYTFPELTKPEQKLICKLMDFDNVAKLIESDKDKLNYYNRGFNAILLKYAIPDYREILIELVSKKWEELTFTDTKTSTFLTGYLNQFSQVHPNQNFNLINRSSIGLIELDSPKGLKGKIAPCKPLKKENPLPLRYCPCGKPLHPDQRQDSIFCSAKYVGEKAAHKCRNDRSNKKHNLVAKIGRVTSKIVKVLSTPSLFDQAPFIRLPLGLNSFQG